MDESDEGSSEVFSDAVAFSECCPELFRGVSLFCAHHPCNSYLWTSVMGFEIQMRSPILDLNYKMSKSTVESSYDANYNYRQWTFKVNQVENGLHGHLILGNTKLAIIKSILHILG